MTRRDRERELRRRLILEAAERVFGTRPYHEATMQAIAAEAELGMQGLYDQFPSKYALYEEVIVARARGFRRLVDGALEGVDEPLEQLRAIARVRVELFAAAPAFLPVFLGEKLRLEWGGEPPRSARIQLVIRKEKERLEDIVRRGIAAGVLRDEDPGFLSALFSDAVTASLAVFRDHPEEGAERCVERAMNAFCDGAVVS